MMEDLKFIIDTYGIEITVIILALIGFISIIKRIIEVICDNYFSTRKQKKIIEHENKIQRSTMAYKRLIEKELEFYENYFLYASNLVTDIQDVYYNYENYDVKNLKKYILKVLDVIPKLKKESILYEAYYDSKIGKAITNLIVFLQKDFTENVEDIIDKKMENSDVKCICDKVLMHMALISSLIFKREQDMSN